MATEHSNTSDSKKTEPKLGPEYDLEYFDFRYPEDCKGKLDKRRDEGWSVHTATIGYPYLHVFWVRG